MITGRWQCPCCRADMGQAMDEIGPDTCTTCGWTTPEKRYRRRVPKAEMAETMFLVLGTRFVDENGESKCVAEILSPHRRRWAWAVVESK